MTAAGLWNNLPEESRIATSVLFQNNPLKKIMFPGLSCRRQFILYYSEPSGAPRCPRTSENYRVKHLIYRLFA